MTNFLRRSLGALNFLKYLFAGERVSVVVPCYNEGQTVGRVVKACFASPLVGEVLVVDDGSSDGSAALAKAAGARVVRHSRNKGKGVAILTGARAARNSVLVFIDADFENVTSAAVDALAFPVLEDEARVCKASFERSGGRVTELTAKPLLEFLFPEVTLQQPLSGQFAVRKEFLLELNVSPDWGVDVGIVLESIKLGEKILEVNIGRVEHKHRSLQEVAQTAREVTKTILQNAGFLAKKHKLVIFDFDKTLVRQSSIELIAKHAGFEKALARERKRYYSGRINERELTRRLAALLKGMPAATLGEIASKTQKQPFVLEILGYLKRMGYKTAVVSFAFRQSIESCFDLRLFDAVVSPALEEKRGVFTGRVSIPPHPSREHAFSKGKAVRSILRKLGVKRVEAIAVGDSASDEDMFRAVGIPVAMGPKRLRSALFRIKSLPELLIIAS